MTVYAPRFTKEQIVEGIWGWTGSSWTPGLTFLAGPSNNRPTTAPDMTLWYETDTSTLWQYHNSWSNLYGPGNEVPTSGSDPSSSSLGAFVNRYDLGVIKECTNTAGPVWINMGSNQEGLPTGTLNTNLLAANGYSGLAFTDTDQNLSANLYLILRGDGPPYDPLLATDQGLVVKKDISAGGMLASNQGILGLGSGFTSADEPPKIWLTHTQELGNQDTLYLKQLNLTTPAHLDLGNLTSHGVITLSAENGNIAMPYAGWIQFGNLTSTSSKISWAQGTRNFWSAYAIELWGWNPNTSSWEAGTLIASNIQVDHLDSCTGAGITFFDHLNLTSPLYLGYTDQNSVWHGVKLYDSTGSSGSNGQFLQVNSSGYPQWTTCTLSTSAPSPPQNGNIWLTLP